MLERGLKFDIKYIHRIKVPYIGISFKRKAKKTIYLHQPTLATLSAIGREFLLFDIQEQLDLNKPYTDGAILADKTSEKMARIIAIIAIGISDPKEIDREYEEKQTNELANTIYYNVVPSMLLRLTQAIRMLCNIENFMSSTSLMLEIKKALPTLVEKEG